MKITFPSPFFHIHTLIDTDTHKYIWSHTHTLTHTSTHRPPHTHTVNSKSFAVNITAVGSCSWGTWRAVSQRTSLWDTDSHMHHVEVILLGQSPWTVLKSLIGYFVLSPSNTPYSASEPVWSSWWDLDTVPRIGFTAPLPISNSRGVVGREGGYPGAWEDKLSGEATGRIWSPKFLYKWILSVLL